LEAVRKAMDLQPDLILLDIGLPKLSGIEAARRIRELSSRSKVIFLSENRSWDIAQEALRTGAGGYVVKTDAARELLPAVEAVLNGKRFVSASLAGNDLTHIRNEYTANQADREKTAASLPPQNVWIARRHRATFYSNDRNFLDDLTLSLPNHIGTGFFHDCKYSAWILALPLSRADISRWMLLTRSQHLCSTTCLIRFDF
jgi:YesN/AraC family two-component response regulator